MTTYLITGANRGIGLELTRQAIGAGHAVIATAREPGKAADLNATGATVHPLDVTSDDSVAALAKTVGDTPIDVLINNAGVFLDRDIMSFRDLEPVAFVRTLDVNTVGPLRVTRALAPAVERSGRKLVVNITSAMGSCTHAGGGIPYPTGHLAYRSSKSGLNMLTVMIASELEDIGVTCVALHPGWVRTDMGGPDGHLAADDAADRIHATIDALTPLDAGNYIDLDGNRLPW